MIQLWTLLACFLVASKSFVSTAPANSAQSNNEKLQYPSPAVDEDVRELENLKPEPQEGSQVAVMKSHSVVISNVNGKQEHHENRNEMLEKDGHMLARISQKLDKNGEKEGLVKTEVDIPMKGIHRVVERPMSSRMQEAPNQQQPAGTYRPSPLQYSPSDLAEYVFWTGDENGATTAIEEFIQDGLLNRDEAITFLEEVKQNLEGLRSQYQADERASYMHKQENKIPIGAEMSEIRQQIRENFNKKADYQDAQTLQSLSDDDYEDLIERLKMADMLYNEYSLEEVIYQLAKIMFKQSLLRGSVETQNALQKFTDFLENEAQSGRISRSLEKKVLDVVIASLSDVLTQHPELVETARQSLGLLPGKTFVQKEDVEGDSARGPGSHRFDQKKETLQNSGLHDKKN